MAKKPHKAGRMMKEKKEFEEEVLEVARVTRVVKGGRRLRFRTTVVIGNQKGKVGIGIGKANEVSIAIKKAVARAKRNLIVVPIVEGDTIPHDARVKFKAAEILMMPAPEGTGIKAGSSTRKIMALAGVKNILSKSVGRTKNKINIAKATMKALESFSGKDIKNLKKMKSDDSSGGNSGDSRVDRRDRKSQSGGKEGSRGRGNDKAFKKVIVEKKIKKTSNEDSK
jgi:small subunit ribosomal protein S5